MGNRTGSDERVSAVTAWAGWLAGVLLLAGAVLLIAGWPWAGAELLAGGVACVGGLVVHARSDG